MASLRLICLLAFAGCYDIPQPQCGFQCGPATGGEPTCPSGYTCVDDRCRLDSDDSFQCPEIEDPFVPDTEPPTVMARSPAPTETDVAFDTIVLVTFDEDVIGVDESTFGLSTDTGFVLGEVSFVSPRRAFRFVPDRPLLVNKTYEVVLGTGITDLAGNPLAETRWAFSTVEDRVGPQIINMSFPPVDAGVVDPLIVVFNEPIIGVTMTSVRLEQAGTVVPTTFLMTFPDQFRLGHDPLLGETTYELVMTDEITDLHGNPFTPTTISFITRDTTPPAIVSRAPAPDAADVPVSSNVSITFSEQAAPDQDIALSTSGQPVDVLFSDTFHLDGTYTITLEPMTPLLPATIYTVTVGVVRDNTNNSITVPSYTFATAP